MATSFNISPTPQKGQGAFGSVPGSLSSPDPYADLSALYPNLSGSNAAISQDILSQLRGELSPDVLDQIQNNAARFGVSSGMPGSGLAGNRGARDLGLTSLDLQNMGIRNYGSIIPTIKGTQTVSPELQNNIATQNSVWAAAPNPAAAQSYAQQLFNQYQQQMRSPAGGTQYAATGGINNTAPGGGPRLPSGSPSKPSSGGGGYAPSVWSQGTAVGEPPAFQTKPVANINSPYGEFLGSWDAGTNDFLGQFSPDDYDLSEF